MHICKYHGSKCETPDRCRECSPRKYDGDGALEQIEPERLILGCILRMSYRGGQVPPFSDAVVTGIRVDYQVSGSPINGFGRRYDKQHFSNLKDAYVFAEEKGGEVYITLSSPRLYAHNIGGSMPGWLSGVSTYEAGGRRIQDSHKVVVMSTGEYANYNQWEEPK